MKRPAKEEGSGPPRHLEHVLELKIADVLEELRDIRSRLDRTITALKRMDSPTPPPRRPAVVSIRRKSRKPAA